MRIVLAQSTPSKLISNLEHFTEQQAQTKRGIPPDIKRIAYLIPRVAARMPWRADCLVQALAARRWLASSGHETQLSLGTRKRAGKFEAHAWLKWHDYVVTGGNIDEYVELRSGEDARAA